MDSTLSHPTADGAEQTPRGRGHRTLGLAALAALILAAALLPGLDSSTISPATSGAITATGGRDARIPASGDVALRAATASAPAGASVPTDRRRAQQVASTTLVLVDGRSGLMRASDAARADLAALGGHTVSFNETEGRPTSQDPCPTPIDAYSSPGLRSIPFPCPRGGQQSDSAQLVMAVPVTRVEPLLRRMDRYGEVLGRATQIVDAQQSLDDSAAGAALIRRQITRLSDLIASTPGDTAALRSQLANQVRQLSDLEAGVQSTHSSVRFAQVALNLTTVRPPDKPATRNGFVRALHTGWDRLTRLGQRLVSVLVVVAPVVLLIALIVAAARRRRRRRAEPAGT